MYVCDNIFVVEEPNSGQILEEGEILMKWYGQINVCLTCDCTKMSQQMNGQEGSFQTTTNNYISHHYQIP